MNDKPLFLLTEKPLKMGWKILAQQEYIRFLNQHNEEFNSLLIFAENYNQEFRWTLEIGTVSFFMGIFPKEKLIRLGSKNLQKELGLINYQEKSLDKDYTHHIQSLMNIPLENSPSTIEYLSVVNELPLFTEDKFAGLDTLTESHMTTLANEVGQYRASLFEKFSDLNLDLVANFNLIRIHLLKYLAILPNLSHDLGGKEVKRLLLETLSRLIKDSEKAKNKCLKGQDRALPKQLVYILKTLLFLLGFIPPLFLSKLVRMSVGLMAKRFIAGERIDLAKKSLNELMASGRTATIDQLGELVVSNIEADEYCEKVLEIIQGLKNPGERRDKNKVGILNSHVSIKVSALTHDCRPQDFQYTFSHIYPRLKKILLAAKENNVFINIDAEHYSYRDTIFQVYAQTLLTTEELSDYDQTGIVLQGYLKDALIHLNDIYALAKKRKLNMPVRLVKGAYWDAETIEAEAHNFSSPQFLNKAETDQHFRQLVYKILEYSDALQLSVASHNIQDHCFARCLRSEFFPSAPEVEHQCLHMTYEGLSTAMGNLGWATRNYIPLGNLLVGMAYLVRRIMENSSQVGVLSIMRSHKKKMNYKNAYEEVLKLKSQGTYVYESSISKVSSQFKNIYPIRSYLAAPFEILKVQIEQNLNDLSRGNVFYDQGSHKVLSPSDDNLILGRIAYDTREEVNGKIEKLFEGFVGSLWSKDINLRQRVMLKLIDLLTLKRVELSSLIVLEAGKTLDEATADVDEAVDFVQFYLDQFLRNHNLLEKSAKGVVGVISPWNFPLAIPCGMTVAPLICGNTVCLKPAEQTPLIGLKFLEICYEAGIPKDVLQVSLGEAEVGKAIVDHELITGIVFTGSKIVGEEIYQKINKQKVSPKYQHGQTVMKFAITEMGGKNAIIVTNNCEMDETISGIIYSAFAHSGQKCSAASRVIIDNQIKSVFARRFKEAISDLNIGKSYEFSTLINPLVGKEDQKRVKTMARLAREEIQKYGGEVLVDLSSESYPGNCVGPSVFMVDSQQKLENYTVANNEVFGPLVHIIGYDTIDEAIKIFNSTEYALTGGVFCQSQNDLDYILPQLEVGNIYVNRPNTGARVAIEPFGGFKKSGTGPKAGGKDYLNLFTFKHKTLKREAPFYSEAKTRFDKFDLARNSKRSFKNRKQIVKDILQNIMLEKEVHFQQEGHAFLVWPERFFEVLNLGRFDIDENIYPNHTIPGQLSYNSKNMSLGNGLLLDGEKKIKMSVLLDVLLNILVGNGLKIVCLNNEIFTAWNDILNMAYKCGLSIYNVSVHQFDKQTAKKILQSYSFKFLLLPREDYDQDFIFSYGQDLSDDFLPKIIYSEFSDELDDRINTYVHTRSFAINTMRHGAPMELKI